MLSWFEDLEASERSSAMAIVDDRAFVKFYTLLLREEQQQQQQDLPSHALFMKDYLDSLFEKAKVGSPRNISHGNKFILDEMKIGGADNAADATLLSYLSASYINSGDSSDFTDPYYFDLCTLSETTGVRKNISSSSKKSSSSNYSGNKSSLALQISVEGSLIGKSELEPELKSEPKSQGNGMIGLESAITSFCDTAIVNVVNKLSNEDNERERRKILEIKKRKESEYEHFSISTTMHSVLAVSFATSATDAFDCLFFLRPATEDYTRLIEIFHVLSNGMMFSRCPSVEEVKQNLTSKRVPMTSWLADMLQEGSPVPYYMLLLSRIELSIWSTYYNVMGYTGYTGGVTSINTNVGTSNNIMMLPRIKRDKISKVFSNRNTLRVLELSPLTRVSSTAVMLSLGCIAEEFKIFWRTLSKHNKAKILNLFPIAKTFYSVSNNPRGRSESIVDRLILCPLEWLNDDEAEKDVRNAYRYVKS
jgi:hypothetical protein